MPNDPVYNPHLPSSPSASSLKSCSSMSSFAIGLCAGAVAGAAAALVLAPMRGSDMRRSVRDYASQSGERLSQLIESGRSFAGDAINQASALIDEGRRAFRTGVRSLSRSSSSATEPLTASVAEISGVDRRFQEPLGG